MRKPRGVLAWFAALCLVGTPTGAATLALESSAIGTASLTDVSAPGELVFLLDLFAADAVTLDVRLEEGERGPLRLDALIGTFLEVPLARLVLELDGASFAAVGDAVDERDRPLEVAASDASAVLGFPTSPPVGAVELGDPFVLGRAPWSIDVPAGSTRFAMRILPVPVPEPAAGLLLLAGLAALAGGRRRRLAPLVAVLVATAAGTVRAEDRLVTSSDYRSFGGLRRALQIADPGDRIVFQVSSIVIDEPITIDAVIEGITFVGPVSLRPNTSSSRFFVRVAADRVTLDRITFEDVNVEVIPAFTDFAALGCTFVGDATLQLQESERARVERNTFRSASRSGLAPLELLSTRRATVIGNTFETARPVEISEDEGRDLRIEGNTLRGRMTVEPFSGVIRDNRADSIRAFYPDDASSGSLLIEENRLRSLHVNRTHVTIARNQLAAETSGRSRTTVTARLVNASPFGAAGPFVFRENEVTGGWTGISYQEVSPERSGAGELVGNTVRRAGAEGLSAAFLYETTIAGNTVEDCGTGGTGTGIDIERGRTEQVSVSDNTVLRTSGNGMRIFAPEAAISVARNTIRNATGPGILVTPGAARPVLLENTIEDNEGPGIELEAGARARVASGTVHRNGGAGVVARAGAESEITRVSFRENTAPGIDLEPVAVTPNPEPKVANRDLDWPEDLRIDPTTLRLVGTTVPFGRVEVFRIETGPREGNPDNGEGEIFLGDTLADANGRFSWGPVGCEDVEAITTTATTPGDDPVTSEFSPNPICEAAPVDTDADGKDDAVDECPETPAPENESGCPAEAMPAPGVAAYGEDPRTFLCTAGFCGCVDCRIEVEAAPGELVSMECDGPEENCGWSATEGLFCTGCDYQVPAGTFDCTDATCEASEDGFRCDGEPGACSFSEDVDFGCRDGGACTELLLGEFGPWVYEFGRRTTRAVRIDKRVVAPAGSIPPDALFEFDIRNGGASAPYGTITEGGVSTRDFRVWGTTLAELSVTERPTRGFEFDRVVCSDGVVAEVTPQTDGSTTIAFPEFTLPEFSTCTIFNRPIESSSVFAPGGVRAPDQLNRVTGLGLPPDSFAVGGENGFAIVNATTKAVARAGRARLDFSIGAFVNAVISAIVDRNPSGAGDDLMTAHGNGGTRSNFFVPEQGDFGFTAVGGGSVPDIAQGPGGLDPDAEFHVLTSSGFRSVDAVFWEFIGSQGRWFPSGFTSLANSSTLRSVPGVLVSAIALGPLGPGLLLTSSTVPGESGLYLVDGTNATRVLDVEGEGRRVRAAGGLVVVTSETAPHFYVLRWDGSGTPALAGTVPTDPGAIGVDLAVLGDGSVLATTTSRSADTWQVAVLDPDGRLAGTVRGNVPEGCSGPVHAVFLSDLEDLLLSCNGSDVLAIVRRWAASGQVACGAGGELLVPLFAVLAWRRRAASGRGSQEHDAAR